MAYLDSSGKVIFSPQCNQKDRRARRLELAVSHDGKKLLYTRSDTRTARAHDCSL